MSKKILYSSLIVSIGVLLGRLMGFVREASLASTFGVSSEADIAVLALTIPDILVSLLVAGGLSAALIPEFKSLSTQQMRALFVQVSFFSIVFFIALALFLGYVTEPLTYLFAPGLGASAASSAQEILRQVFWLIPLTVLAGVTTAYLQSQGKFVAPAMGTFIFNACVVLGLVTFVNDSKRLDVLVYFILLGGLARWLSQLWVMRSELQFHDSFSSMLIHKDLLVRYGQAVVAMGLFTLFPVVARSFASFSGEGGVAMMNYAWRLVELPLGLVITVLAVVLFPKLAELHAQRDEDGFDRQLHEGLAWSLLLAAAIMGPILAAPEVFVSVVYGWGDNIASEKMDTISMLLQVGIVSLPFQAVLAMCVAAFNARKRTKVPMMISFVGFVLLIPICWLAEVYFALFGAVSAIVACYIAVSGVLLFVLRKECKSMPILSLFRVPTVVLILTFSSTLISMSFGLSELVNISACLLIMVLSVLLTLVNKVGVDYVLNLIR
ncbi:MAG: lipid II flippase MurJ [Ghiorsea sp.]|nr:lipid II flippase MurJ [Ghiorsea sp.]